MFVSVSLFRLRSLDPDADTRQDEPALPYANHRGYQSVWTPDQVAAEHIYLSHYAPALSRLPGLKRHLVGRAFTPTGAATTYSHLAAIYWEDRAAWAAAMQAGASERLGIPPIAEWAANIETFGGELEEVIPPGVETGNGVLAVRLFDLKGGEAAAAAERYYTEVFAPHVRQFAGVRRYLRGPVLSLRNTPPRWSRLSVIECTTWEAMQSTIDPELPPGISPLADWTAGGETYITDFEEVPD